MHSPIITILILFFTLLITIYFVSKYECSHYKIIKKTINSNKILKKFSFIFITDLHDKLFKNNNEKLINDINNLSDNIFIGGDLITFTKRANKNNNYHIENAIDLINNISKDKNVYYAFGNHELRLKYKQIDNEKLKDGYNLFYNSLVDNNINILDNKYKDLESNIRLYGYSLHNRFYKKRISYQKNIKELILEDIEKSLDSLDNNKFNICLLHNPDFAEILIDYGFDMVLCGHHHGGIVRFPLIGSILSPDLKILPKYSKGIYTYHNKTIIVSAGLGEHTIKFRLNNICELYKITLSK